jgi:hypothetical protein
MNEFNKVDTPNKTKKNTNTKTNKIETKKEPIKQTNNPTFFQ